MNAAIKHAPQDQLILVRNSNKIEQYNKTDGKAAYIRTVEYITVREAKQAMARAR